ncbi:hypothetical protein G9A89_011782 [Geosiphon pyriformis]|nr:hypothetical protein G9A89_011782 [Geosiphon pyriformis]
MTPKGIQPPTWKKTRVELPTNPFYHYTPGSAINISLTGAPTSNMTSTFGQLPFQKDALFNNLETNQKALISNILPATIMEDKSLAAIFFFEIKKPSATPLFSGTALEEKPITAMYTNAKVDGHAIKFILNSRSANSIITQQLMDQLGR